MPTIPLDERRAVLARIGLPVEARDRDGIIVVAPCAYCAQITPLEREGGLHFEHVQPRHRGGQDVAANLVLACPTCNASKGTRPAVAFIAAAHKIDWIDAFVRLDDLLAGSPSSEINIIRFSIVRTDWLALTAQARERYSIADYHAFVAQHERRRPLTPHARRALELARRRIHLTGAA